MHDLSNIPICHQVGDQTLCGNVALNEPEPRMGCQLIKSRLLEIAVVIVVDLIKSHHLVPL